MSRISIAFKLKDLYAIKHALQKLIEMRKEEIKNIKLPEELDRLWRLEKDITHEEKIIEEVENEINNIRIRK